MEIQFSRANSGGSGIPGTLSVAQGKRDTNFVEDFNRALAIAEQGVNHAKAVLHQAQNFQDCLDTRPKASSPTTGGGGLGRLDQPKQDNLCCLLDVLESGPVRFIRLSNELQEVLGCLEAKLREIQIQLKV